MISKTKERKDTYSVHAEGVGDGCTHGALPSSCVHWGANELESKPLVKRKKERKKSHTYRLTAIATAFSGAGGLVSIVLCRH